LEERHRGARHGRVSHERRASASRPPLIDNDDDEGGREGEAAGRHDMRDFLTLKAS
jgi:hypothetical protein